MEINKTIVVSLDSGAKIVEFNEYAETLTQYTKKEVIGKNWFEIFIPDAELMEVLTAFNGIFNGENNYWEYSNDITIKDGTQKNIRWNNTIIKDKNDKPKYIYSIGTEI